MTTVSPHAHTSWGDWGHEDWCDDGHFAYGFRIKVEAIQGGGDDTGVNGILLHCKLVEIILNIIIKILVTGNYRYIMDEG